MKNKLKLMALILIPFAFITCKEDNDNDEQATDYPTQEEFSNLQDAALDSITQTATFNAEDGITFTSENYCNLHIYGNSLTFNSTIVTGEVTLEFIEIFEPAHMLVTNKPTMGVTDDGDLAILESAGEFYINVTQNGNDLDVSSMYLDVPASLTNDSQDYITDMTLWNGEIDEDGNLEWEEVEENKDSAFATADGEVYYVTLGNFGWANVDRFYNYDGEKTTILVDVPDGYDGDNSAVFLLYDDMPNALAQLDTYDETTGLFSEHYGQVPVGLHVYVIFVSEQDGSWVYAVKDETIEADETIVFTVDDLQTLTYDEILDAIRNL